MTGNHTGPRACPQKSASLRSRGGAGRPSESPEGAKGRGGGGHREGQ